MVKKVSLARTEEERQPVLLASPGDGRVRQEDSHRDSRKERASLTFGGKGGKAKATAPKSKDNTATSSRDGKGPRAKESRGDNPPGDGTGEAKAEHRTSRWSAEVMDVTQMNWNYIAGFIDGEGCFSAYHSQNTRLHLSITNTDKDVLYDISKFIETVTGFKVSVKTSDNSTHIRQCYRIYFGPPILRKILPILTPLLRVKRFQAETMQCILDLVPDRQTWLKTRHLVHNRKSDEDIEKLEVLIDKLRWANHGCP